MLASIIVRSGSLRTAIQTITEAMKCVYFVVELTSRMQDCFFFSESEIKVVADLQKKWEMSDIMLSYLDTYWDVC